jgi:hypothetical protein
VCVCLAGGISTSQRLRLDISLHKSEVNNSRQNVSSLLQTSVNYRSFQSDTKRFLNGTRRRPSRMGGQEEEEYV